MKLTIPQKLLLVALRDNPKYVWENYAPLKALRAAGLVEDDVRFGVYRLTAAGEKLAIQVASEMRS